VSVLDAPATRAYLERTVRTWLGVPADAPAPPELPAPLARLLLRLEEHERAHRDRYGLWEHAFSESFRRGRLWTAEIDEWVAERRVEPLWPEGRAFAACLTHDVDLISAAQTPRQALRHARAGLSGSGAVRFARPPVRLLRSARSGVARAPSSADVLDASTAVERNAGVVGSYLFAAPPGGPASRFDITYAPGDTCAFRGRRTTVAGVMRTLAEEGFDVGLHGSYGAARTPGALAAERERLERATGLGIRTTRQHFLHWHAPETPALQEQAGLRVDSSAGFNRNAGFRAGTSLPFRVFDVRAQAPLRLLEVPLVVQDGALLAPYGLELDLELALLAVEQFVDEAAAAGGIVTFLFHPNNLLAADHRALYERTVALVVERGAWVASLAQVGDWWSAREARLGLA
jgi:hypothetical protein